ncbi:MAG: PglZ domain-containing protein [Flavobacteriaceae bacterium]|jgi:CheY-like chemotaxis protein|nr:PglZ domain-containing protein [Flavobacteriaceae bacterium]MDG1160687.1 PglZ domain-containing protein [Flavobacteriaceae bacterium]MDG1423240.1 PglZ domain-containing protein [Flavobacteriaceae bacterium]MDG1981219.1 PglZ domain-containing protein [Flavobacteriaceae bacterium]MDG2444003.1 PglZ domain-containing protein [Flavobacteriaceae bacterium]|tara:strand:+ start:9748 stop:11295 length:1548 start_codon:yes stop_codon:yes gene_type:complete
MNSIQILWVDDEIDLLKPHILFLEQKGYNLTSCTNGADAIELVKKSNFDIIFLDENMPGINGLETLSEIKQLQSNLPVVMITKSEEEYIMEEAIGSKIADYLIKPVNPNQILLSLKKNLDHSRLISEKTTSNYQQEFRKISMDLMSVNSHEDWVELYKKLVHWELELENINDSSMLEILESQKSEANNLFYKFIKKNYQEYLTSSNQPTFSHTMFKNYVVPNLSSDQGVLWIVIDNLRYDQYRMLEPLINNYYKKEEEYSYYSILPTATQYARNSIFSGLMPSEMEKKHPKLWKNDTDEGGKNMFENEFLRHQINRLNLSINHEYYKITSLKDGKELATNYNGTKQNDLTVLVYNFVDMLSHAKTEMEVIKELAGDDKAYRSLTVSWFKNSPLFEIIKKAQQLNQKLIITTDHGTINCKNPTKIIGDRNISSNLRYKTGKSISYSEKDVFAVKNPKDIFLPSISFNSPFIFAKEDLFFAYPNNYNHFVNYYKNTYQHGGVSLEEMIIPCVVYSPK